MVIRDNLSDWVDDHVVALIMEFTPEDDAAVVVVGEGISDGDDVDDAGDNSDVGDKDNNVCEGGNTSG